MIAIRVAVCMTVLVPNGVARADDWPTRPVTLVVPYPAGGPTDVIGRLFAHEISGAVGQPVVVENVPGGGGMTGASRVARAAPDGYQLLFGGSGNLTFNQIIQRKPAFNSLTDFTPVALLTEQPLILIARRDLPVTRLAEFQDYVRRHPATFGSAGVGSSTHLGCVMLNLAIGANSTHVPYRGNSVAMQDLMAGRIDYYCDIAATALPQIKAETVKAIVVLAPSRLDILPDLPSAGDETLPSLDTTNWYGLLLPKNSPAELVDRLNQVVRSVLEKPSFVRRLSEHGVRAVEAERRSSEYLAKFLRADIARWAGPIRASGVAEE